MTSKFKIIYDRINENIEIIGDDVLDFLYEIEKDLDLLELYKKGYTTKDIEFWKNCENTITII